MLKNKLGITNQIELADVEEKITKKKELYCIKMRLSIWRCCIKMWEF